MEEAEDSKSSEKITDTISEVEESLAGEEQLSRSLVISDIAAEV